MDNVSTYCRLVFGVYNVKSDKLFFLDIRKNISFNMRPYLMRYYHRILLNNKCKAS